LQNLHHQVTPDEKDDQIQGICSSEGKRSVHLSVTGSAGHAQMDGTLALTAANALDQNAIPLHNRNKPVK
jgi:hypothetical protein